MTNNNTSQNTTVSTVVKSESSIYLKRSELPKNLSSFKNDVGYISTATLDAWLKDHSYLSKSEVNALIKKANLVVLDTVNKSYDEEAIGRLNNDIIHSSDPGNGRRYLFRFQSGRYAGIGPA